MFLPEDIDEAQQQLLQILLGTIHNQKQWISPYTCFCVDFVEMCLLKAFVGAGDGGPALPGLGG